MLNEFFVFMFYFEIPLIPILAYFLYKKNKIGFLFLSIFNLYKIIETFWIIFFNKGFSDVLDDPPTFITFKFIVLQNYKFYLIFRVIIFILGIFFVIFHSKIFVVNKFNIKDSPSFSKEILFNTILILVILIEIAFIQI